MFFELIIFLILCKLFAYFTCGKCTSKVKMVGKTVIVTGANSGLGKEVAKNLAFRGARVIMACRNLSEANKAKDEIVNASGNKNVIVQKLDVSSMISVREFAKIILETENRLDVLIHNAGVYMGNNHELNSDGIDMTMATNHFGPFLLTHLLIDLLRKSDSSRIVIVSSLLHILSMTNFQTIKFDKLNRYNTYNYIISKHANVLFTTELARRLKGNNVIVNCVHPGAVKTNIFVKLPLISYLFVSILKKLYFKTIEEGIQSQIYASIDEKLKNVSGKYIIDCIAFNLSNSEKEMKNAKYLWDRSEKIVNLKPEEKLVF